MTKAGQYTNHLSNETSPYLLQHANNPVDWYPWGPEALEKARRENKPILLSVGYSACHWCHVMAHESFEDHETAALVNELFVNIKVDREERPDLDKIYQTAHSLLTQRSGGWPLTMFLTPEGQIPFFAGTYFPKEPRHGLPSFTDLCERVVDFWKQNETEIIKQNDSLVEALTNLATTPEAQGTLNAAPLETVRQQLEGSFDQHHGGFGQAPKFPHPTSIERLLRHWANSKESAKENEQVDKRALDIALFTLKKMALGGMYDQIGGGFCRYSVDEYWMIPHFEKMLYDNGPLLCLYTDAWAITGDPFYKRVCKETSAWVRRRMQSPEGGYYSSLDADSEGEEGKYYVWDRDEVKQLLDENYPIIERRYGLDGKDNFEGKYNFHVYRDLEQLAKEFRLSEQEAWERIKTAHAILLGVRQKRVPPGRDDKILTSWNGLMIKGMAKVGRHCSEPACIDSAERALDFIRANLWQEGRLLATYKDGRAHLPAYLDDYVFLADGILELLQARWRDGDLAFAIVLMEVVLEHFQDPKGGFFFTADDHETLIQRPKPLSDDATPSGNGVAATVLGRLGHLLGEPRYLDAAQRTLQSAWAAIDHGPYGHTGLLIALEENLVPPQTVVIRGASEATETWKQTLDQTYAPRRMSFLIPDNATDLPGVLAHRKATRQPVAYLCTGTTCSEPIHSLEQLQTAL